MATVQIFLSTVSAEFHSYRDALRHDLDRPNVTVKVQEDFVATGTETLDKLDGYIQRCDAVIHLVGDMTGALAQAPSVTVIRQRYPDFDKRLPALSPFLQPGGPALSYTQWEAWLALYHGKLLIICVPQEGAPRDEHYSPDQGQRAAQQAHLARLASVERYPEIIFANADRLAVDVLRSHLQEILASAQEKVLGISSVDWPGDVLERLSTQLNTEFIAHMQAREGIPPDQARARYVQGVVKLREKPDGTSAAPNGHTRPKVSEGPLEDFSAVDGMQLLLIGAGGSGKTTILKHAAADIARRAVQETRAPIVIYLRLAEFDRGDGGLDLLLKRLSLAAYVDQKEFEMRWQNGRRPIVFLLDGLNEVAQAYQASCSQAVQTFLLHSPHLHRCVITSRPGGDLEATSSRSGENQRLQVADILKFGPQQVNEYLKAQGRTELQSRISGRLEDLASNPFLLWAITRTLGRTSGEGRENRGSLFAALIDGYIFEDREASKPGYRATDYNYKFVKKPVLAQLALKMTQDGVSAVKDGPELRQQVSPWLKALEVERLRLGLPLKAGIFMPEDYLPLSLLYETVSNGVLVQDGSSLRFMHECVQEYFAAVALDRTSIEEIVSRAPRLNLASPDARGPMFETFISWAGLSTREKVTAAFERLEEWHPLLAAHLAAEAALPADELQKIQGRFLSLMASEHEQRQRIGVKGLAILPSEKPEIEARLIDLLHVSELDQIVEQSLEAVSTRSAVTALVKADITRSEDVDSKEREVLRKLAVKRSNLVVEALLEAWTTPGSPRGRIAQLAAFLDAEERFGTRRPAIREALLIHAVEAELIGDLQKSNEIDALRDLADQTIVEAPETLDRVVESLKASSYKIRAFHQAETELAAAYREKEDSCLEGVLRDGSPFQRACALEELAKRGSPAAVAPLVARVLKDPLERWLSALGSLPRKSVREHLAELTEAMEGEQLERARVLAALLEDRPAKAVLEKVLSNFGQGLRAFAVSAALRAGAEGVELLIEQLSNESNTNVLATCINVLGESRNPIAVSHLVKLLFEPSAREHWPPRWEVLVSDSEAGGKTCDGWALLIHNALVNSGAVDRVLEHLELYLCPRHPVDADRSLEAINEARRLLPEPRAVDLLKGAMASDDSWVRLQAQWSLACAGESDAWRALLRTELDFPATIVGFAQDAARRLGTPAIDSAKRDLLVAVSQSVLRPALSGTDIKRSQRAVELARRLPEDWVGGELRREALAKAEELLHSVEVDQRVTAVRTLRRFADDYEEKILGMMLSDCDEAVVRCTFNMLGNKAAPLLRERMQSALESGDGAAAQNIGGILGTFLSSEQRNEVRDTIGKWLATGDRNQCVAAMLSLAMLHPGYDDGEEWKELSKLAYDTFQRQGAEKTWECFAIHARSLSEEHRYFVYLFLYSFAKEPEQLAYITSNAAEIWPDDLNIQGTCILSIMGRGHRDEAAVRLAALAERFCDRVSHVWIGDRFVELERPQDALRHYHVAAESNPTDDEAWFKIGRTAFMTGNVEEAIGATRCSLQLQPTRASAEFNLGIALLARGDLSAAENAYRCGMALAKRQAAVARQVLEEALGDFSHLPALVGAMKDSVDRIRTWLQDRRDRTAVA